MRRLVWLLLLGVLAGGAIPAHAGGGHLAHGCAGFSEGTEMGMADSCFEGVAHFVPAGESVTVRNDGDLPHTITAVDGSFDSGQVLPGDSYTVTVDEPGAVRVYCTLHGTPDGEGMAGVLLVGEPPTHAGAAGSVDAPGISSDGVDMSTPGALSVAALVVASAALVVALRRRPSPQPASG